MDKEREIWDWEREQLRNFSRSTSSHKPLSLQSYGAELDVYRKEPSPFQHDAACLSGWQSTTHKFRRKIQLENWLSFTFFKGKLKLFCTSKNRKIDSTPFPTKSVWYFIWFETDNVQYNSYKILVQITGLMTNWDQDYSLKITVVIRGLIRRSTKNHIGKLVLKFSPIQRGTYAQLNQLLMMISGYCLSTNLTTLIFLHQQKTQHSNSISEAEYTVLEKVPGTYVVLVYLWYTHDTRMVRIESTPTFFLLFGTRVGIPLPLVLEPKKCSFFSSIRIFLSFLVG